MIIPQKPKKFSLSIANRQIDTLPELQNYFVLDDIINNFQSGTLHKWLQDRNLYDMADKLYSIPQNSKLIDIIQKFVEIFSIKNIFITPKDSILAEIYVKNERYRENMTKEFLNDKRNMEKLIDEYLSVKENKERVRKKYFDTQNVEYSDSEKECQKLLNEISLYKPSVSAIGLGSVITGKRDVGRDKTILNLKIITKKFKNEALKILKDDGSISSIKKREPFYVILRSCYDTEIKNYLSQIGIR